LSIIFQDSKTKAGIEAKMAELNQQMSIEHRNRRKTQEYYRKLVEATKASSKGGHFLFVIVLIFHLIHFV